MKVLLMAYECSPHGTSERAVGWGRLLQAVRVAEVHVVTSERNFKLMAAAQRVGVVPADVRLYTPEPDARLRSLEKKPALYAYNYTAYEHWQRLAMELVQRLHKAERFDLVHQVNVCTFREPGYTWQLGIPYVWGPVGGSQNFPARYLTMLPPNEALKEGIRGVVNWLSLRMKKRVRGAGHRAAVLLAANSTNRRDYERAFGREVGLLLETGVYEVKAADRRRFEARVEDKRAGMKPKPLRLLWIGELQTRKALPVLLRALAAVGEDVSFELKVMGAGPLGKRWEAEAQRLGLTETGARSVKFCGQVAFAEVMGTLEETDLFCFTSLRDTSGNVVLEALGCGVPVVCFDHQGARDMVSEASGVRLPVTSPSEGIREWALTIRELFFDAERLLRLSEGATERAREFLWEKNGDRMNMIYREVAGQPVEFVAETTQATYP